MLILRRNFVSTKYLDLRHLSKFSTQTQPAVHSPEEPYEKQIKDYESLKNITRKPRTKQPQKPPFVKNLFIGKFDTDILAYPELNEEDVNNLEKDSLALSKLLQLQHMTNCKSLSSKQFRQNLSDYRAIGLQASQFLGGKECNVTESLRYLEVLCEHDLGENILNNEQLGVQTLSKFANEQLQKKYLYPVMKGELLTAFCLNEDECDDVGDLKTRAEPSKDGKSWTLNGKKCWVVNGNSADIFIVFAITRTSKRGDLTENYFSGFVIERDSPGVTVTKENSCVDSATISFDQTPVPSENVIGTANEASDILKDITDEFRLTTGSLCIALTKKLLNNLSKSIMERSNDTNLLYKTDAVREKIGEIITSLYAMESMAYLTSGLRDNYEKQDCILESAIVKVFTSQEALKISTTCLDLMGPLANDESLWAHSLHKQCIRQVILPQNNDNLKIILALLGLQYAGEQWQEKVDKIRNPLFHYSYILSFKKILRDSRNVNDKPKLDLRLGDHLHPSCAVAAQYLEYCVKRFEFATELLLVKHGGDIVSAHMDLRRMADIVMDLYAMTASLARASRSYCIGNQWANVEVVIANCFCTYARERVRSNVDKIYKDVYGNNDDSYRAIAKKLFKFKEYYIKHPLKRNC